MPKSGVNPESLKNLNREGRPMVYDQRKKNHNITVTTTGWEGAQATARSLGYGGVSEFVEQVGRGQLHVEKKVDGFPQTRPQLNMSIEDIARLVIDSEYKTREFVRDFLDEKFRDFLNQVNKIAVGKTHAAETIISNTEEIKEDLEQLLATSRDPFWLPSTKH